MGGRGRWISGVQSYIEKPKCLFVSLFAKASYTQLIGRFMVLKLDLLENWLIKKQRSGVVKPQVFQ